MVEQAATVKNRLGIHARPAAYLVQEASKFQAEVTFIKDGLEVNGKSIMGVMMLAAEKGAQVLLEAEGSDAEAALEALGELLASDFEGRI